MRVSFTIQLRLSLVIFLCSLATLSFAQSGIVTGQVISSSNGSPIESVAVSVKGKNAVATTDQEGRFSVSTKAGSVTLVCSFLSARAIEKTVNVEAGKTIDVGTILFDMKDNKLQEVFVDAKLRSEYVARLPLKSIETPQVYNTVGKEIMEQQIVTDYKQSLRNISGGGIAFGNVNNGFAYTVLRGFWTGVRLRNGVAADSWSGIDPVVVERSEAIKGPSGTLYGNSVSSFGGLINLVSKQPFEGRNTTVDYTLGSFGLHRIALDLNAPLNEDKSVLFRLNAAYHSEGSFMDWGFNKRYVVAPSLIYKINQKLTLTLNAEFTHSKMSSLPYIDQSALNLRNMKDSPLKYNQSVGSDDATFEGGGVNIFAKAEYLMSRNWKSTTIASLNANDVDELVFARGTFISPNTIVRTLSSSPFTDKAYQFQQFFNTEQVIAGLKNKFVMGLDVLYRKGVDKGYFGQEYTDTINITQTYSPLSLDKIKAAREKLVNGYQTSESTVYAAYASSVTNISDRLSVLLGLRMDRFDNKGVALLRGDFAGGYKQTAFSPKFGAVYQVLKDQLNVFASYTNAFQNNAPVRQPSAVTFSPKPTSGNQYEFGVKADVFEKRLTATVSYFNIDIRKALRSDQQGYTHQDSKQTSKGFEIDLTANPVPGLNITAGYGYNKNVYVNVDADGNAVRTRNYLPADYANVWVTYKITNGVLRNLGLGAGTNYVGELNKYTSATKTDAYFLTDGTVFYEAGKVRLGLKVNNVFNQKMWGLNDNPLALRSMAASVKYSF